MNKIYQHIFRYALIITNKNISLLHTDINIICSLQSNSIFKYSPYILIHRFSSCINPV